MRNNNHINKKGMFYVEEENLVQIEKWVVLNTINEADGIEVTTNDKKEVYLDREKDIIFNEIDEIDENSISAYILPNQLYIDKIFIEINKIGKVLIEII